MKKPIALFAACIAFVFSASASPVSVNAAQKVATNFFSQVSPVTVAKTMLAYTETDTHNNALYYVFNINSNDGFVIVSADNALHPIIGYSTEKRTYAIPAEGTTIGYWMQQRKTEIIDDVLKGVTASAAITKEWADYTNNTKHTGSTSRILGSLFPSYSTYLVQSTWNQESPYSNDCPGVGANQAVTGCVATAMCQIMRYWQYPATGQGSNTYYSYNYGTTLTANFNHPYAWSTMPLLNPSILDTTVPRIMSDAGISVDMYYSPTGSGAQVITADGPVCAQNSYVQYFKYSPTTINGLREFANSALWQDTLENELNHARPVQYVGYDPAVGGHTWVCDGYDANNNFHMNWGWGGYCDGWYSLTSLNPAGDDFSQNHEAIIGIEPLPVSNPPVAAFTSSAPLTCTSYGVQFIDTSTNQPTSWNWTFTGGTPSASTSQNPLVTYATPGNYPVQLTATNTLGNNTITTNNYITIDSAPVAPAVQCVGSSLTCVPATYSSYQWYCSGVIMSGATSSQLWIWQKGDYSVMVTNAAGCEVTSPMLQVLELGVNTVSSSNDISVYPNPASTELSLSFNLQEQGNYIVTLTNVLGQTVYTNTIKLNGADIKTIDVSNYSKGVYNLTVTGQNNRIVKHIVVN